MDGKLARTLDGGWEFADPTGGGASGELLVQDGTTPPVDLTLEDESDYLYEDI